MTKKLDNIEGGYPNISDHLIYEMVEGKPIYYRGYQAYLNGNKQLEELKGSSYLQSAIITHLVFILMSKLNSNEYRVLTNELGLQFKNGWRAVDIAIVEKEQLRLVQEKNKYLNIPPKIVIEIDTKAEMETPDDLYGYFHHKTEQLLEFGVEKVIWIFTSSEKVMIAEQQQDW
ncbi:MAG: Uma2 family endonuclease, partial [Bacteroidota bacterium]